VLRPPPLAFHNAVMEIQEGFVEQVQVVRRLLLHEKLKVGLAGKVCTHELAIPGCPSLCTCTRRTF